MNLRIRNISKGVALLVAIMIASVLAIPLLSVKADPGYYWINNPVFGESIDDQGGAWDTVLFYYREGLDLFSGNWRANLRIGDNQAWIDSNYFPAISCIVTSSSITSVLELSAPNPYGLPAGAVRIEMNANMIPGITYLGLRGYRCVLSEPWVMQQTYTVINAGEETLYDVAFFMYYFAGPYGMYPVNPLEKKSHVDYTAGIGDPMGYVYDITLYGEGDGPWAYTAMSADIAPTGHDVGHGGGYPDPPYYNPNPPWRPSAISTDVLRQVENDNMRGWAFYDAPSGSDPNAVAGAFKWCVGCLAPRASWSITILQSVAPHDAPILDAVGKVTGGGQIAVPSGKASFGFNIMYQAGDIGPKGELQYVDQGNKIVVHSHDMTTLTVSPDKTKAFFTGKCTINGAGGFTFKAYVEDNSEPGKTDVFKIMLSSDHSAGGILLNGNIQIHKKP